jgi:hypothetical protein
VAYPVVHVLQYWKPWKNLHRIGASKIKNLQSRLTDIIDLLSYGYKIQAANQGAIQGEAVQEQAQQ